MGSLLAIVISLSGCSRRSIVGVWNMPTQYGPLTVDMTSDKLFRATGRYLTIDISVEGRYSVEGNAMKITPTSLEAVDPTNSVPAELIERGKALFGPEFLRERAGTVEWKSDDEVVLTETDGEIVTLTRQKPPSAK